MNKIAKEEQNSNNQTQTTGTKTLQRLANQINARSYKMVTFLFEEQE